MLRLIGFRLHRRQTADRLVQNLEPCSLMQELGISTGDDLIDDASSSILGLPTYENLC